MKDIERGDIFWISATNDSTYDRGTVKTRPGIVISNDFNNRHAEHVEVVFLTTAPKSELPTHCTIRSSRDISTALCEQISTVNKEQLESYIGKCTDQEMAMVDNCALISIGIKLSENTQQRDTQECNPFEARIAELESKLKEALNTQEIYKNLYDNLLDKLLVKNLL